MTHARTLSRGAAAAAAAAVLAACGSVAGEAEAPAGSVASATPPTSSPASPAPGAPSTSPSARSGGSPTSSDAAALVPTIVPDVVRRSTGAPDVVFKVSTRKPVFFITIDDGVTKQQAAADYVRATRLPVTTFLYNGVVEGQYKYFAEMSRFDAVQNHTMDHKALSKKSTNREYEICRAQQVYTKEFGVKPWILRPPYGAGFMPRRATAPLILAAAASCGIKYIALWNVSVEANGRIAYASGHSIHQGDIVLLHYEGDLAANLKKVVRMGAKAGLTPASLSAFLGA